MLIGSPLCYTGYFSKGIEVVLCSRDKSVKRGSFEKDIEQRGLRLSQQAYERKHVIGND